MRFPPSFLDEIRARLPASVVVGKRVKLKKQGREFAGLSPFNQERTPSFFVNDSKGKWFDFSAQKNGDIFTFLMEAEGLSFPEAVERLAAEAGVPMPERDPEAEAREAERASLYEVLELAAKFFEESLQAQSRRRRPRLPPEPRPVARPAAPVPHRLCPPRPQRAEGAPRRQGHRPGPDGRRRASRHRRRRAGLLRPLPRAGDFPDQPISAAASSASAGGRSPPTCRRNT